MMQGSFLPPQEHQQTNRGLRTRPRSWTEEEEEEEATDRLEMLFVGIGATCFAGALTYALYDSIGFYSLPWFGFSLIGPVLIVQACCCSATATTTILDEDGPDVDANELVTWQRRCPNCDQIVDHLDTYDHWRSSTNEWIKMVRCRECGYHGKLELADGHYDGDAARLRRCRIPLIAKIRTMIRQSFFSTTRKGDRSEEQRGLIVFGKLSSEEEETSDDDDSDDDETVSLSFGSVMVF